MGRARLLKAQGCEISPEAAQFVLSIGFAESDYERVRYLLIDWTRAPSLHQEQDEFDCSQGANQPGCRARRATLALLMAGIRAAPSFSTSV